MAVEGEGLPEWLAGYSVSPAGSQLQLELEILGLVQLVGEEEQLDWLRLLGQIETHHGGAELREDVQGKYEQQEEAQVEVLEEQEGVEGTLLAVERRNLMLCFADCSWNPCPPRY